MKIFSKETHIEWKLAAGMLTLALVSCGDLNYEELRNPTSSYTQDRQAAPAKPKPVKKEEKQVPKEEPKPEPKPEKPKKEKPEPKPEKKEVKIEDLDLSGNFPVATAVEGKPGIVISPHSGKKVDVKGVPSGSLIADPRFPLEDRKWFIVP